MKTSTPILSVIQRQHAEDDKADASRGRDPYNSLSRREADIAAFSAAQAREAEQVLACYETTLTIEE